MATITLSIIKSKPKNDGKFSIKYKITNSTSVAYITTQYSVELNQWNGGQVVRHPQAATINSKLFNQLNTYQVKLDELNPPKNMKASKISELLQSGFVLSESIAAYAQTYISKMDADRQKSYISNMGYTIKWLTACFGKSVRLKDITSFSLCEFESYLTKHGQSNTTINIRMSHLKALLNAAVNEGVVEYKIFPFRNYKMPTKNVRDLCISKDELTRLRDAEFKGVYAKRFTIARDFFMLSFYCAGINFTDLLDATFNNDVLSFVRKKTAHRKTGSDNRISISIQPEARAILNKYLNKDGRIDAGYNYSDNSQFRVYITKALNIIGRNLGFEKPLMYYSARKTFVQLGTELGIPLYILEYAIGHTIKEANNRPIFNYLKVMRHQADLAIRTITDYSNEPEDKEIMIIPEWARRKK